MNEMDAPVEIAIKAAAVVYPPEVDADALLARFAERLKTTGIRVGGVLQEASKYIDGCPIGMAIRDVETGESFSISQTLGKGSTSCMVDPQGVAAAAGALRAAIERGPDIVVASKFSGLEIEGGGLAQEILEAMARGIPVVVIVPQRFYGAFVEATGGLTQHVDADDDALWQWWENPPGAAQPPG